MNEEIDQLSAKLALVIPEQKIAETAATTAKVETTADITVVTTDSTHHLKVEHSVILNSDSDLLWVNPNLI